MSNVLITGGTGFIGSALAKRLSKEGDDVIILGRNEKIGKSLETNNIKFLKANLEENTLDEKLNSNIDYIFHVGAKSSLWGSYKSFYEANVLGTANIISLAENKKIKRLIHVSSPSIYTEFKNKYMIKESDKLPKQINYYSKTKLEAESLVFEANKKGLETIIIRPRAVFGIGDTALLPRIITTNEKGVPIINGGNAIIDITYIDNVVESLVLSKNADSNATGHAYNITNDDPRPIMEIIKHTLDSIDIPFNPRKISEKKAVMFATLLEQFYKTFIPSKEPPITRYGICILSNSQTLDISKSKELLGYSPKVSIDEGLKIFSDWWKKNENKLA